MKYYTAVKKDQHILVWKKCFKKEQRDKTEMCAKGITLVKEKKSFPVKNRNLDFHAFPRENRGRVGETQEPWNEFVPLNPPPLNKK